MLGPGMLVDVFMTASCLNRPRSRSPTRARTTRTSSTKISWQNMEIRLAMRTSYIVKGPPSRSPRRSPTSRPRHRAVQHGPATRCGTVLDASSLGRRPTGSSRATACPSPRRTRRCDGPIATPPPIPEIPPAPSIDPAAVDPPSPEPPRPRPPHPAPSPSAPARGARPRAGHAVRPAAQSPAVLHRRPVTPRQGGGPGDG